ncbi:MAG TPA: hypothetical protein VF661_08215 [Actinomycetales bacterium]|jgi:hypothetical protein
MSDSWSWRFEDVDGNAVPLPGGTAGGRPEGGPGPEAGAAAADGAFPTQSDAESWLGEEWRGLLDGGVEAVSLLENGELVYGPMSLRPVQ